VRKTVLIWQDVLQCWEFDCGQHVPPLARQVSFEHVQVLGPFAGEIVDWCPVAEFEKQKMAVSKGQYSWYRDTLKGTLHTAELLWEYRDNAEMTALILLGAFLFEHSHVYEGSGAFRVLTDVVSGEFRRTDLNWWHHLATNALPVPRSLLAPTEYYGQYVTSAVAASWIALTTWKLVVVHQIVAPHS
jgi:hypothetical protein